MIHVCSLARLHRTVDETGARHVVTLMKNTDQVMRPAVVAQGNHLILNMDDIIEELEGHLAPAHEHVEKLVDFASRWDRSAPMVVHCYAGISRSTAGAYVAACALNPTRDEMQIALALRRASRTATPNARIVALADKLLDRKGRMTKAIATIGPGEMAYEADPFRLDLD